MENMNLSLVDSHAHLSMSAFDKDRESVIQRAFQEGVTSILCPIEITDPKSIEITLDLIDKHTNIIAAAGVHPHHAQDFNSDCMKKIEKLALAKKVLALGEIGLDFHYSFSPPHDQKEAFRQQIRLAKKLSLPVVIHSREAKDEIARVIEEEKFTRGGILHCFTEDWNFASHMMDHNFHISFSGILTFPQAYPLREVAKKIPIEKLLVETDSPYLVPVPHRGKINRNEPSYVKEIAQHLAGLKNISLENLASTTTQNFKSLFMFEIKKPR